MTNILFRVLFVCLCCSTSLGMNAQTQWKTFTHPQFKYTITYPPDWKMEEKDSAIILQNTQNDGTKFICNVNFIVHDYTNTTSTFKSVTDEAKAGLIKLAGKEGEFKDSSVTMFGRKCMFFDEKLKVNGYYLHFNQFFFMSGKLLYVVTYTAKENNFDEQRAVAMKIINSFNLPK